MSDHPAASSTGFVSTEQSSSNLDVDLGAIDLPIRSKEEQEKLTTNTPRIRRFVEEHLQKLDALHSSSKEAQVDPEVKKTVREKVTAIWERIREFLNHPEAAYRLAAWVGLIVHFLKSANPKNFAEAQEMLDYMVKNGYLLEVDPTKEKFSLTAWKRTFRIPSQACFGRLEFEEAQREITALVRRTMQETLNRRNERVKALQGEATLEPFEVFERESKGTSFLYVPPQVSLKEGRLLMNHGGFLLVDIREACIYIVEGVGSFEDALREAYAENLSVKIFTLELESPPSRRKLEEADYNDAQIKEFYLAWGLLKRAKDHLQKGQQYQEQRLHLSQQAGLPEKAFFLERQDGITFVDFEGVWENWSMAEGKKQKETIRDLFFLIERREGKIKMISCPPHLETFFSECRGSYREGEKFFGVAQPLQAMLQAQYGACQTKSLIA